MGHHSKKNTQTAQTMPPYAPPFDINGIGQLLNNIDINSMSNMMKNIDINQVMSVLSKTITPQPNAAPTNETDNPVNNTAGSAPINSADNTPKTGNINPFNLFNMPVFNTAPIQPQPLNPFLPANDPTVMVLNSLKPFLPPDKCKVIDDMIQLLGIKLVIDKVFPPGIFSNNNQNTKKAPDKADIESSAEKNPPSE